MDARWRTGALAWVFLGLVACTPWQPWQVTSLNEAVEKHATQAGVTERFGTPFATKSLSSGGSEWTYRYQGSVIGGPMGGIDTGGAYCRDYVLTFDDKDVLRDWRRERC